MLLFRVEKIIDNLLHVLALCSMWERESEKSSMSKLPRGDIIEFFRTQKTNEKYLRKIVFNFLFLPRSSNYGDCHFPFIFIIILSVVQFGVGGEGERGESCYGAPVGMREWTHLIEENYNHRIGIRGSVRHERVILFAGEDGELMMLDFN